jgi:hypothetical protein
MKAFLAFLLLLVLAADAEACGGSGGGRTGIIRRIIARIRHKPAPAAEFQVETTTTVYSSVGCGTSGCRDHYYDYPPVLPPQNYDRHHTEKVAPPQTTLEPR